MADKPAHDPKWKKPHEKLTGEDTPGDNWGKPKPGNKGPWKGEDPRKG